MGPPLVVVLDSNVLVSALGWRGAPHEVYSLCRDGTLILRTSKPLLRELERVLDDNRVLECAVTGSADWIVSGDEHLLALRKYQGIRIASARALLDWL